MFFVMVLFVVNWVVESVFDMLLILFVSDCVVFRIVFRCILLLGCEVVDVIVVLNWLSWLVSDVLLFVVLNVVFIDR